MVATHNRADRLTALLDSLRAQTLPRGAFEVVVVDDGSADGTAVLLEREGARGDLPLRLVRRESGGGPSVARNAGWPIADAPLVAFTDDDCEADPRWLEELLHAHEESGGAIVQGRTDPLPSELHLNGPFSRTVTVNRRGPHFQTCNILYPKALLGELRGFDAENFSFTGEDTDLAWRALARGQRIVFAPEARVFHAVASLGPVGYLRAATRWSECVALFPRHPELRRAQLHHRFFWHGGHWSLFRALVAVAFGRRMPLLLRNWLLGPYLVGLGQRVSQRGGGPLMAVYWLVFDVIEMAAMLRASARYRTLVI